jgi:hypothetical protein
VAEAVPSEDLDRIEDLVARDDREEALVHAFRSFGLTPEEVEQMRASPTWSARVAAAHTVTREVRAEEAYRVDPERFRDLAAPVLLLLGEESPDWAREGTERIRAILPDASRDSAWPGARGDHDRARARCSLPERVTGDHLRGRPGANEQLG